MEKDTFIVKEDLLDDGKINIGFGVEEAIMEAVDDSFDNGGKEIQIRVFNEVFTEFKTTDNFKVDENCISSYRNSYIICDDGTGVDCMDDLFEFGNKKKVTYVNKEELMTTNKRFHYGIISHLNVGSHVIYYSKCHKDKDWKYIELRYDRQKKLSYIFENRLMSNEEKNSIRKAGIIIPKDSGTILYVRGLQNTKFNFEKIESFEENLNTKLGITYNQDLCEGKRIIINNVSVTHLNPLCLELTDEFIAPMIFGEYEITLEELLGRLKDDIYYNELFVKFESLFINKDEMLKQSIKIKLVSINLNFSKQLSKVKNKFPDLNDIYFPTEETMGFYIKRNKRYVGAALGMLDLVKVHGSKNRFRAEISFSPIFDDFFAVQIDKNRNALTGILISAIQDKILNDNRLQGNTVSKRIQNILDEKLNEIQSKKKES